MFFESFLVSLLSSLITTVVLYYVIKYAVRGAILEADEDRKRRDQGDNVEPPSPGDAIRSALTAPLFGSKPEPGSSPLRNKTTLVTSSGKRFERPSK